MANLDQELTHEERKFTGKCWGQVHESGKVGMSGLSALCETIGITMDALSHAVEGCGDEDCTMDQDEFVVLMGRLLRSGLVKLPQPLEAETAADNFIGQCWEGIQESGTLNMTRLNTFCETLNITMEAMNKAIDGLGTEDCTLVFHEFVVMMKRLLDCKAVVLPPLPDAAESANAREEPEIELGKVQLDYVTKCWDGVQGSGRIGVTAFNILCETLDIHMEDVSNAVKGLGNEAGKMDHDEFVIFMGRLLQCGAIAVPLSEFRREKENDVGDSGRNPNWMVAMTFEPDEDATNEAPTAKALAPALAWMTSLAGHEVECGENDTETTQLVAMPIQAAAWMNTMVTVGDVDDIEETDVNKVKATTIWMNAMADNDGDSEEEHDEDELLDFRFTAKTQRVMQPEGVIAKELGEDFNRLLDFSFTPKKQAVTPESMSTGLEEVEEDADGDFDQLIDNNFTAKEGAVMFDVVDVPPAGVVNWMDMMLAPADAESEEETFMVA